MGLAIFMIGLAISWIFDGVLSWVGIAIMLASIAFGMWVHITEARRRKAGVGG